MFNDAQAFSGFSTDNLAAAVQFYGQVLGLQIDQSLEAMGILSLKLASGGKVLVYQKENHVPATYTVLNFPVENLEEAVDELVAKGVVFERYEGFTQDGRGISRAEGQAVAWFKDPAGNILSVLETN